jgi:hypothetical protein
VSLLTGSYDCIKGTRNACIDNAGMNWSSRRVKEILLLIIAGLLGAGCCSTKNDIQRLSTSDLQLRRYELMYCLSMARTSWDKQPLQNNAYNDVRGDLEEKEAIEREITRRGVTDYHWSPSITYRYVYDHCQCRCWVTTL